MESKEVKINKDLYDLLIEVQKDRRLGSIAFTADPIYLVQNRNKIYNDEDNFIDSFEELFISDSNYIDEDDNQNSIFTLEEIKNKGLRNTMLPCKCVMELEKCKDLYECIDILREYIIEAEIITGHYEYITKAYFISYQETEDYLKYQGHNLTNPRIYEDYIGYDNRSSLSKLIKLLDKGELFESNTGK